MATEAKDKLEVRALAQGINLTDLRKKIGELEALCNAKIDAAERFADAITVAGISSGIMPAVLSQYIVARVTDTVKKKARSANQLSLLFDELE